MMTREETNFRGDYRRYMYEAIPNRVRANPLALLTIYFLFFFNEIRSIFRETGNTSLRIYPEMVIEMERQHIDAPPEIARHHIVLNSATITQEEIKDLIRRWIEQLANRLETAMEECPGSGFILTGVISFSIVFLAQRVSQVLGCFIKLPVKMRGKNAILNPSGSDNGCLLRCLAAYKLKKMKLSWCRIKKRIKSLQFCKHILHVGEDISLPIEWGGNDMKRIEQENNFSIHVYTIQEERNRCFVSLARKGKKGLRHHVPILLVKNKHATLIKEFDTFIRSFTRTKTRDLTYCRTCLSPCSPRHTHEETCTAIQSMSFPHSTDDKIKFKNFHHGYAPSHIAFYDIESLQVPAYGRSDSIESIHHPFAVGYVIVNSEGRVVDEFQYVGKDCINVFIKAASEAWGKIRESIPAFPIHTTPESERKFEEATHCDICKKTFSPTGTQKVRHHTHRIEFDNLIAALCPLCNLLCVNKRRQIRFFSHNLAYDGALILRYLTTKHNIKVHSRESGMKLLKLEIDDLMLLDSLALMPGSLSRLSENHIQASKPIPITERLLSTYPLSVRPLLLGKQMLCYDYLTHMGRLEETRLPPKECFYNRLKGTTPTEEEYLHAQTVFTLADCRTLKDYIDLYLKLDVTLLADVFLHWREILRKAHGLDIVYYLTLPSFAYDCFLRETEVELDPVVEKELYLLLRDNLRGGFTTAITQLTDVTKNKQDQLMYLDFNSLYSQCMTLNLPFGEIRKLTQHEEKSFLEQGFLNHDATQNVGYWILCDIRPRNCEIARSTDELPLCLNHHTVTGAQISPYTRSVAERERRNKIPTVKKLIASHLPQQNYLISLRNLQLLIRLGLEVEKVHCVYQYAQKSFLKDFITKNIELRRKATCPITALSFKLINNAIYGKFLMDVRRYSLVFSYCTDRSKFLKLVRNPYFKSITSLGTDKVLITSRKPVLYVKQATYIGFAILEHAKFILYDTYYNTLKKVYRERLSLIYSDTDSFILKLQCDDLEEEYKKEPLKSLIDFSNFPKSHQLHNDSRRGELGLLKSEIAEKQIEEVIALQAKSYSLKLKGEGETLLRAKGIPKNILTHANYRAALEDDYTGGGKCEYHSIRSHRGEVITCKTRKTLLSAYDDKRFVLSPVKSLAYGHPDIRPHP